MSASIDYLLHLADNALVLGQRNAQWCGHAPVLEEDLALANNSLDLIGQARLLYAHAADCINAEMTKGETPATSLVPASARTPQASEDSLAYWRDVPHFRNHVLLELPHHAAMAPSAQGERDFAVTVARNFLYSAFAVRVWEALQSSADSQLAAIAAKSLKEVRYHLRHASDWVLRLGDGTPTSHARLQAAFDHLMPYTQEFWSTTPLEADAQRAGVDVGSLKSSWAQQVRETLSTATLSVSSDAGFVTSGKTGHHSEHMGYLLGEMQSLARAHPGAQW